MSQFISSEMDLRVKSTFQSFSWIESGKKSRIVFNDESHEVDVEYYWIADISDESEHHYGMALLKSAQGIFGAYTVAQNRLEHDTTLFPVVKFDDSFDDVHEALSHTTFFPSYFELTWDAGVNCSMRISTPAIFLDIHFRTGVKKDPMIEKVWKALMMTRSKLFKTHNREQQDFVKIRLFPSDDAYNVDHNLWL